MMTNSEERNLGDRMQRMEKDIAEIKAALLGNVIDGSPGILGRVRDREQVADNHDLRLVRLETAKDSYATKTEVGDIRVEVSENTEWRLRVMWMMAGAGLAGALTGGGIVAALMQVVGG